MTAPHTDGSSGGYVRLYRRLLKNPIWTQAPMPVLRVMLACLLEANWKPATWYDGTMQREIPRGSFVTSYSKLAALCRISVKQVRGTLKYLERAQFAAYERTHKWTMITVLNYATYQDSRNCEGAVEGIGEGNQKGTLEGNNRRSKKKEVIQTCASDDARVDDLFSVDAPPFETTDTGAALPVPPPPKKKRAVGDLTPWQEARFAEFWPDFWLHEDKKEARIVFGKIVTSEAVWQRVRAGELRQRPAMLAREPQFRRRAAKWLRGESWNNEPDPPAPQAAGGPVYTKLPRQELPKATSNG